ncbi:hypothetical protein TrVE_jg13604 [Triparma verrucosa]|uniref:Uncharacterized protein n=1 Tax=Triparma verrucosa TaxID=1606542 RepID=A0A9W7BAT3_9STRA|nr:hypothetical protein TrVE_jg13604 [Triparma verrucosa]
MPRYAPLILLTFAVMFAKSFTRPFLQHPTRLLTRHFSTPSAAPSASLSPLSSIGSKVEGPIAAFKTSEAGTLFSVDCSDMSVDGTQTLLGTTLESPSGTAKCYMVRHPLVHMYTSSPLPSPTSWSGTVSSIWKDIGNSVQDLSPINSQFITRSSLLDTISAIGHGQNMLFMNVKEEVKEEVLKSATKVMENHNPEDIVSSVSSYIKGMSKIVTLSNLAKETSTDQIVYISSISILKIITEYVDSVVREKYGEQGISDSESRSFYSDVVQRSAKFRQGSMTVILELNEENGKESYEIDEFNEKDQSRLKILKDKGVTITENVLEKLSINRPGNWGEEFISLSDGQVVWNKKGEIDVKKSCTRVGVGTGLEKSKAMCDELVEVGGNGVRVRILQEIDNPGGESRILKALSGDGGVEETAFKIVWGLEGGGEIGEEVWEEWREWKEGGKGVEEIKKFARERIVK